MSFSRRFATSTGWNTMVRACSVRACSVREGAVIRKWSSSTSATTWMRKMGNNNGFRNNNNIGAMAAPWWWTQPCRTSTTRSYYAATTTPLLQKPPNGVIKEGELIVDNNMERSNNQQQKQHHEPPSTAIKEGVAASPPPEEEPTSVLHSSTASATDIQDTTAIHHHHMGLENKTNNNKTLELNGINEEPPSESFLTTPSSKSSFLKAAQRQHHRGVAVVHAVHAASSIDHIAVRNNLFKGRPLGNYRNSFVVDLPPSQIDGPLTSWRYIAIFRYGSVVFFNVSPREQRRWMDKIKTYFKNTTKHYRKENYKVWITNTDDHPQQVNGEFCVVKELDRNCVSVIAGIMAQTVALDSYNDQVEALLSNFSTINNTVTQTGNFPNIHKETLFRSVAQNNGLLLDMVRNLRVKDRSDTAWDMTRYEIIHEGMKDEFEIENRFENIEFKLNMIQTNAKFFLEILQHQKSNFLEWIIIVLILVECVLMVVDMSGSSLLLFEPIKELITW